VGGGGPQTKPLLFQCGCLGAANHEPRLFFEATAAQPAGRAPGGGAPPRASVNARRPASSGSGQRPDGTDASGGAAWKAPRAARGVPPPPPPPERARAHAPACRPQPPVEWGRRGGTPHPRLGRGGRPATRPASTLPPSRPRRGRAHVAPRRGPEGGTSARTRSGGTTRGPQSALPAVGATAPMGDGTWHDQGSKKMPSVATAGRKRGIVWPPTGRRPSVANSGRRRAQRAVPLSMIGTRGSAS